jgi:outer membrane protein W/outer membrane protein OmpA-like peptidoglycan-associated protein
MNRNFTALACVIAGILFSTSADAQDSRWQVRAGVHDIMPKTDNGKLDLGTGPIAVDVDDAVGFTFDFTYFANNHWGLNLLLAAPFEHDIDLANGQTVTTQHLPPTLSAVYQFNPDGRVRPYLGAGINYTKFFSEDPNDLHLGDSMGPAAMAGLDVGFTEHWFATLDVRWMDIDTNVSLKGVKPELGTVSIDPFVAGLMVGYRFGGPHHAVEPAPTPVAAAAPPPAPAPAPAPAAGCGTDSDGDGVCDAMDKCPSTPAGDTVDKVGCSLVSRLALYFDFDRAELRPESINELERIVQFMNDLPEATALIEGHTDSMGTDAYNLALSDRRAKSVFDYLASRGISPSRLQSVGKGESQPVADNATEQGRALNRRVMLIRTDGGR